MIVLYAICYFNQRTQKLNIALAKVITINIKMVEGRSHKEEMKLLGITERDIFSMQLSARLK
ncbi:hypothetical protein A4U60_10760 [Priestia endophytica]|nr:hypothetical protein A4U60_10760 [Priestia endophytica]